VRDSLEIKAFVGIMTACAVGGAIWLAIAVGLWI